MVEDTFKGSIKKSANHTADAVAETFHDTRDAVRETADGLNSLVSAVQSDAKNGVRELTRVVEHESSKVMGLIKESIQERPNLTVGVAAGLGILMGLMLSGRR